MEGGATDPSAGTGRGNGRHRVGGSGGAAAGVGSGGFDPTPLLRHHHHHLPRQFSTPMANTSGGGGRNRSISFLMMGRAANRGMMRSPSMTVRETAALQLEERQSDWGYSRPIVALDIVWNLAFVLISGSVMLSTVRERPPTPIRAWVFGYALQCLLHAGFVWLEYRRRRRRREGLRNSWEVEEEDVGVDDDDEVEEIDEEECRQGRLMKKLESTNAVISFLWWILGFYWIVVGGQTLLQDAPRLYWLTVVFLAFDVFFAIFCILVACFIGIALCCCLPCIIAILYAVAGQEGASDADLSALPRFRFRQADQPEMFDSCLDQAVSAAVMELDSHNVNDLALSPEDSECCICLSHYEDGVELHSLPCNHHFHTGCIVKWLRINATCPLCKYSILKGDEQV